jgi:beta-lactamase regulating signal transducer with metallopeptidase domain
MNWLPVQTAAQISVERILNALPEGLVIALFAWALLRVLRRQNSGTRFVVWFLTLLTVAALPLLGFFGQAHPVIGLGTSPGNAHPAITIPEKWALLAFLFWGLGTFVAMGRLAAGFWRLRGLRRSCTPIVAANLDPAVQKTLDTVRANSITVVTSERVRVPAAIGFWKPTIVLPGWALQELVPEDLNVILLHEFAHLRRCDDWTNLIQKIVRAIFFFHPAVWWIENRLSIEREMACDDAVLAETANPHGYATCLVSLLEKSLAHRSPNARWSMAQAAVHRAREAAARLAQILDRNRPVATRVGKPALSMIGAFSVLCLALLPHAPEFVAVDRSAKAGNSAPAYSSALIQPSLQLGSSSNQMPAIPARLDASASLTTTTQDARRSTGRPHAAAGRQLAPARIDAAQRNPAPPPERVVAASASADQERVPHIRTVVFVEAMRYRTSDSSGWKVQVWRMTVVRERLVTVPVANKT